MLIRVIFANNADIIGAIYKSTMKLHQILTLSSIGPASSVRLEVKIVGTSARAPPLGAPCADEVPSCLPDPKRKAVDPRKAGKKINPLKTPTICTNANMPNMYFTTNAKGLSTIGRMPMIVESELCKIAGDVRANARTVRC